MENAMGNLIKRKAAQVVQINGLSCTLACIEAFLANNGILRTQADIIRDLPLHCSVASRSPGYVLITDYVQLCADLGILCQPLPTVYPSHVKYPKEAVLIGAVDYSGGQHSLLWFNNLPGDQGAFLDPSNGQILQRPLSDMYSWKSAFWGLSLL